MVKVSVRVIEHFAPVWKHFWWSYWVGKLISVHENCGRIKLQKLAAIFKTSGQRSWIARPDLLKTRLHDRSVINNGHTLLELNTHKGDIWVSTVSDQRLLEQIYKDQNIERDYIKIQEGWLVSKSSFQQGIIKGILARESSRSSWITMDVLAKKLGLSKSCLFNKSKKIERQKVHKVISSENSIPKTNRIIEDLRHLDAVLGRRKYYCPRRRVNENGKRVFDVITPIGVIGTKEDLGFKHFEGKGFQTVKTHGKVIFLDSSRHIVCDDEEEPNHC